MVLLDTSGECGLCYENCEVMKQVSKLLAERHVLVDADDGWWSTQSAKLKTFLILYAQVGLQKHFWREVC